MGNWKPQRQAPLWLSTTPRIVVCDFTSLTRWTPRTRADLHFLLSRVSWLLEFVHLVDAAWLRTHTLS